MICLKTVKKFCNDYTKIENYEKAMADDTQTWVCHHRLGILPFSQKTISRKFLEEQGLYFNQPPESLIFLEGKEHRKIHGSTSMERIQKMSDLRKGKSLSNETKAKISEAHKGKKMPVEAVEKMRKSLLGFKQSEETKKKHSDAMTGHIVKDETKAKISEALKGKYLNNQSSKKVLCVENETIYPSAAEAARQLNVDRSTIGKVCRGIKRTTGGFHFRFVED